ncbi:hypothetical protein HNP40_004068 [Mycobacteroides chelonae]|nr:hypothetical protein [Mycobacteroides chelonae]
MTAPSPPRVPSRLLERTLLILTVVGFVLPNAMVIAFNLQSGFDQAAYFGSWFSSLPSAQLFADLAVVTASFWVWVLVDRRRTATAWWWLVFPTTLLVGICFAVPLYLWLRERQVRLDGVKKQQSE